VVEVVRLELETHHAVIEPVSPCAGNGNFRCRDRGAKSGFSLAGDGYRDYQKRAKAPHSVMRGNGQTACTAKATSEADRWTVPSSTFTITRAPRGPASASRKN
jgi:hypothetical protein